MTAPRDPIEAPATEELHAATLRRWLLNEDDINGDRHHFRVRELDAALAAARDEGRQGAVQEIRDGWDGIKHQRVSNFIDGDEVLRMVIDRMDAILDDVARPGRSSDPEPAPLDVERLAVAIRLESIRNMQPLSIEAARLYAHAVEGEYARLTGAVPALQATGEPTDE